MRINNAALFAAYWQNRSVRLRNQIVEKNLGLVYRQAKFYAARGGTCEEDLVQAGSLGLIQAVERFEDRGFAFSTFATAYIRGQILHHLKGVGLVWVPAHIQDCFQRGRTARAELSAQLGRRPSEQEVAQRLGLTLEKWQTIRTSMANRHPSSLATPLRGFEDITLEDTLLDNAGADARDLLLEASLLLERACASDRDLLTQIYLEEVPLKSLAATLGISQPTLFTRKRRALKKLKRLAASKRTGGKRD